MFHPLPTLIESNRRQVRAQSGRPTPRRRSATEEAAIAHQHGDRSPVAGVALAVLLALLLVAVLALV